MKKASSGSNVRKENGMYVYVYMNCLFPGTQCASKASKQKDLIRLIKNMYLENSYPTGKSNSLSLTDTSKYSYTSLTTLQRLSYQTRKLHWALLTIHCLYFTALLQIDQSLNHLKLCSRTWGTRFQSYGQQDPLGMYNGIDEQDKGNKFQ